MAEPARAANRKAKLIIKFPQWYDRFHLFGYDPPRMSPLFSQVWVGTEVRDPETRRMGFVQPMEGYMNFTWLVSIAGRKVVGAWFDHIECDAQRFVDQAYASVLAGAEELTLFRLGDILEGHPGDALLARRLPELRVLAERVRGKQKRGIAFYRPAGADAGENLYLADYLGMIGLPILPVADYPVKARAAFLPAQAGADRQLLEKMEKHLNSGASVAVTPALLRRLGPAACKLAGVEVGGQTKASAISRVQIRDTSVDLEYPLAVDEAVQTLDCEVCVAAPGQSSIPILTRKAAGRGKLLVLNVRTFSEQDFLEAGEWVLAPRPLGLAKLPQCLAEAVRGELLLPLGRDFRAPSGVALVLVGREACVYSFSDRAIRVGLGNHNIDLLPHQLAWIK
jgi:hypothetical protein